MLRTSVSVRLVYLGLLLPAIGLLVPAQAKDEKHVWPPITPEELALKSDPTNPGAAAIILNREEDTDDENGLDTRYYRIKVFNDEGKKYADVEIPFVKGFSKVEDIEARTVRPDGTAVDFKGQVFEKVIVKAGGVKYLAKTFSLPDIQVGSIIEYKYRIRRQVFYDSRWIVQSELSTRKATFFLQGSKGRNLAWVWWRLPGGKVPEQSGSGPAHLQLENVPGFPEEEYMPPPDSLKAQVQFYYVGRTSGGVERWSSDFWKQQGKKAYESDEGFIGGREEVKRAAAEIVSPNDPPDAKLRKLYARVQQIRNLSFEREKTEEEQRREKLKDNNNVEDVLKHGYGNGHEINRLFAALARAAGFDAGMLYVAGRSGQPFEPNRLSWRQLNANLVQVRLGSQEWYLDPATRFCPYNLLPWQETEARGVRPEKEGSAFVTTPSPKSAEAIVEREAALHLDVDGTLAGNVQVKFIGQEALERRLDNRHTDAAGRKKALEDEVKDWLPKGSTVELKNSPTWESSEESLSAEFTVKIQDLAAATGRRLLLPLAIFQVREKYPFRSATRVHPIYFRHCFQELDTITVTLPKGYQVDSLPARRSDGLYFCRYEIARHSQDGTLRLERRLVMDGYFFRVEAYSALRAFYDSVRAGDEEQVVLKTVEAPQAN
jgi:transglutaminase-like putative cysteine protease